MVVPYKLFGGLVKWAVRSKAKRFTRQPEHSYYYSPNVSSNVIITDENKIV
jgi:hypothetical protein